jgi:hypothetical protein
MNSLLKPVLLLAILAAPFAGAQVTLNNFNAFESDNTFFVGDWELTGGASTAPRESFSQGAGFYNFAGGSNDQNSFVQYFFTSPVDITGLSLLQISAKLLPGNTAQSFEVMLFDGVGHALVSTFFASELSTAGFTTLSANLDFGLDFQPAALSSFLIGGNLVSGTDTLNVAIGNLAVAAPVSAVPEPASFGLAAAIALLGVIAGRRLSQRRLCRVKV